MALTAWTAYQGKLARDDLVAARAGVERLTAAVSGGQADRARVALADIQDATAAAAGHTDGPGWAVGAVLPFVGDDVSAVRTVADVSDRVARDVLPGIVDASAAFSPDRLQPESGAISLAGLEKNAEPLAESNEALQDEVARVDALRPEEMMDAVAAPVSELQTALADAVTVTDRAATAADLLPTMLGGEGERTYLVLFQTNAEVRATGGIPGALAVITAKDGVVKLQRQGTARDLGGPYATPVLPLTDDELAIFSDKIARYPADITFSPDFPRVAEIARAMWEEEKGQRVDGVLATDPVALSYLLRGTGPIAIEDQGGVRLTAANAADLLLNGVYLDRPDRDAQNEYFADAATSVFDAVIAGQGAPRPLLDALVEAAGEQRLLVWSADDEEQQTLETTVLSGRLPVEPTGEPQIGIYLNDATGTKLDYYLDYDVSVEPLSCTDGVQVQRVTVDLSSGVPKQLSAIRSVLGLSRPRGWLLTNVYVYGPVGGSIGAATLDGEKFLYAPLQQETRPIAGATIELEPGQSRTVVYDVVSGAGQTGDPQVSITPGVPGSGGVEEGGSAC